MISETLQPLLGDFILRYKQIDDGYSHMLTILTSLLVFYGTWRVWTFSINPALYPFEPKVLPYSIPGLGHAIPFLKNPNQVFNYGRKYFRNSREPYAITIVGEKLYVITSAEDVSAILRNTKSFTFEEFVRDISASFGATPRTVELMFQTPLEDERSAAPRKHFIDRAHDYYKLQLHPGEKLDIVQEPFLGSIEESLQWQNISGKYVLETTHDTKTVSIYGWCSEVLLLATTKAFFGDSILQIEPNILQGIHDFDNANWKLLYKIPRFWAKDMWEAKDLVHGALLKYFKLPLGQRSDGAWVVQTLESEMRDMGVDDQQIASILMMTYWVINANAYKLCFWILAYLLHNPALLTTIIAEVTPAFHGTQSPDITHLLTQAPHLEALYDETIRLTNSSIGARTAIAPVTISGKTLKPGTKVIMPFRQLHFDEGVFGANIESFNAERFLNRDLAKSMADYR